MNGVGENAGTIVTEARLQIKVDQSFPLITINKKMPT